MHNTEMQCLCLLLTGALLTSEEILQFVPPKDMDDSGERHYLTNCLCQKKIS